MADNNLPKITLMVQALISLVALGAAVYIILSKSYDPAQVAWAAGVAGVVIGYWLR